MAKGAGVDPTKGKGKTKDKLLAIKGKLKGLKKGENKGQVKGQVYSKGGKGNSTQQGGKGKATVSPPVTPAVTGAENTSPFSEVKTPAEDLPTPSPTTETPSPEEAIKEQLCISDFAVQQPWTTFEKYPTTTLIYIPYISLCV